METAILIFVGLGSFLLIFGVLFYIAFERGIGITIVGLIMAMVGVIIWACYGAKEISYPIISQTIYTSERKEVIYKVVVKDSEDYGTIYLDETEYKIYINEDNLVVNKETYEKLAKK